MKTIFSCFFLLMINLSFGQMVIGNDTLYGNEWIDYDKNYFKILLAEDGIYRISGQELQDAGVPINTIDGNKISVHFMGEEYPFYVSNYGNLQSDDFIEFVGRRNRAELDKYLYQEGTDHLLNTQYSLFTDTSAYFLSWDDMEEGLRYQAPEFVGPAPAVEEYILVKDHQYFNDFFMKPSDRYKAQFSDFQETEGFGGLLSVNHNLTVNAENVVNGPSPRLSMRFGSLSSSHMPIIKVNGTEVYRDTFNGFVLKDLDLPIDNAALGNQIDVNLEGTFFYYDNGVPQYFDKYTVSELRLTYPQSTSLSGDRYKEFIVEASTEPKYFELTNFDIQNGQIPIIYDMDLNNRIEGEVNNGVVSFRIPAGPERNIIVINQEAVLSVNDIEERNFINYDLEQASYLFITNKKLLGEVEKYADYRNQEYSTAIATVDQIYDQFGFGLNRHSMSLKNFGNYVSEKWDELEYSMIVGKAVSYESFRKPDQIEEHEDLFLVPTYGTPGSDNLIYSSGPAPDGDVKVGRLAARNDAHVSNYLEKIRLHDLNFLLPQTIEDRSWMKNIIHLSGGDVALQLAIKNFLSNMEVVIENNLYGANVSTFYKTSSDNLQDATSKVILDLIKEGTPLITFFGHSAVGTFDFSLEQPEKWLNKGRNPIVLSLGCYSGNIHSNGIVGLSEDFVLEPEYGAIAFIASAGTAYVSPQAIQGVQLYDQLGTTGHQKSFGTSLANVRKQYSQNPNLDMRSLTQQFTFHGDPAISLYGQESQDYLLDYTTVETNPGLISSGDESFEVSVDVVNIGANVQDTIDVEFIYQLPDGEMMDTTVVRFRDTLSRQKITIELDVDGIESLGKNTIFGKVDYLDKINESPQPDAENNNTLVSETAEEGFCFFILDNTAKPAYPCNFDIVSEADVVLKAATSNAYTPAQNYVLELDTTEAFTSNLKERKMITQGGGLIEWNPELNMMDNTVYYWRVSPDSISPSDSYIWQGASFLYKPSDDEGWNQSHYWQYLQDDLQGLDFNAGQQMIFDTTSFSLEIVNALWDQETVGLKYNNGGFSSSTRPWRLLDAGIAFSVVDPITGVFWENISGGTYGGAYESLDINSGATRRSFAYPTSTLEEREKAINFLTNVIPDGHFVYVYTLMNTCNSDFKPEEWTSDSLTIGTNLFRVLEDQGAGFVRDLESTGSVPYSFIYQKGVMNPMAENIASNCTDYINIKVDNPFLRDQGSIETTEIGPARIWDRLVWKNDVNIDMDSTAVDLLVYNVAGEIDTTYSYKGPEGEVDISFIDAKLFPTLKIRYTNEDLAARTSPNLEHLKVYYTGYPDIGFDPESEFVFNKDTLQRGAEFSMSYSVRNLSSIDMDSITIKYILLDSANNELVYLKKEGGIAAGSNNQYAFTHPTKELLGKYQITVELNTEGIQQEKQLFNNILLREFYVEDEKLNPLLDVTFDGTHILDGDIVSPSPMIYISLKDENPFLALDNPDLFELQLKTPNDNSPEELSLNSPELQFFAGNESDNTAHIEYNPTFTIEGEYELWVQGRDVTDNFSGDNELVKRFNVILDEKVTNVINYPNPFSTATQFVFTLTGQTVPDIFNIRIMTLSGKVVREITKDELGPLKIGVNKTDFVWNGSDEYGEPLANGVYLYKAFIKYNDKEELEHLETGIDQYYDKGYGKLVIMR